MWNKKSLFMHMRVRIHTSKRNIRIRLLMALYVMHQLLLSVEGLAGLIPGKPGMYTRTALDSIHALIIAVICSPPEDMVDVNVNAKDAEVFVKLRTIGFGGGHA